MSSKNADLSISVYTGHDADDEELDKLARQLCDELAELDTVSVGLAPGGELPEGAMGLSIGIGTVLVKVLEAGGITGLLAILGSWLSRDERRSVMLQIGENKLEVTGVSAKDQAHLIQWFQTQTGLQINP